jgi:hypothetical protein
MLVLYFYSHCCYNKNVILLCQTERPTRVVVKASSIVHNSFKDENTNQVVIFCNMIQIIEPSMNQTQIAHHNEASVFLFSSDM